MPAKVVNMFTGVHTTCMHFFTSPCVPPPPN